MCFDVQTNNGNTLRLRRNIEIFMDPIDSAQLFESYTMFCVT